MATPFSFTDNTTQLSAANLNQLVNRSHMNMVRNCSFTSWIGGTAVQPDGWVFTAAGGTIGRFTLSDYGQGEGQYAAAISKAAADAGTSYLEQDLTPYARWNVRSLYYTASVRARCMVANKARLYIDDGIAKQYSDYITTSFSTISTAILLTASATSLKLGIEYLKPDSGSGQVLYIDCVQIVRGQVSPTFQQNPMDQGLICQFWSDGGAYAALGGGVRLEPFKKSGTLTGGTSKEMMQHTLYHGCVKILFAAASAFSFGTTNPEDVSVNCDNYGGTTTLDINLKNHAGNFTAAEAYEIRGIALVAGWDTGSEVFGE